MKIAVWRLGCCGLLETGSDGSVAGFGLSLASCLGEWLQGECYLLGSFEIFL